MTIRRTRHDHRPGLVRTYLHGTDVLVAPHEADARGADVRGADVRGVNMSLVSLTGWRLEFGEVPPAIALLCGVMFVIVELLRTLS